MQIKSVSQLDSIKESETSQETFEYALGQLMTNTSYMEVSIKSGDGDQYLSYKLNCNQFFNWLSDWLFDLSSALTSLSSSVN